MSSVKFTGKSGIGIAIFVVLALVLIFGASNLVETVQKGSYHIIQKPVTGTIKAIMDPGMYPQLFADVKVWPKSETFYFTFDKTEGKATDQSIEVRFNDGSLAKISGTCRIMLPTNEDHAKQLMTKYNFRNYDDLEHRFILPILRNSMRLTANLMTARESYAEKRADFINHAWDQIQYGQYKTQEVKREIEDPLTGLKTMKAVKVIMTDANGDPIREHNPLEGTGISLANFEVKSFEYEKKVKGQIAQQQENFMAIATAKAQAERADQEAKTREAEGKAKLMEVRYTQLQIKERAVIDAQRDKEVAELGAAKLLEVATFDAKAADQEKTANILRGEGESERKRLVMAADGALEKKLKAWLGAQGLWAKAFASRKVPSVYMSGSNGGDGSSNPDNEFTQFMSFMNTNAALDLKLKMQMQSSK